MLLSKCYKQLAKIKSYLKNKLVYKHLSKQAILVGEGHNFSNSAQIKHEFGSSCKNVILQDHSELFGTIICCNDGKVELGRYVKVGFNCTIYCANNIRIGDYTAIANNVTIVDHNYHPINPADRKYMRQTPHGSIERSPIYSLNKPVNIGQNVWLGNSVRVCKGVSIGDNSIIGANSVVTKDIPANCIAVGNPARVVKTDIHLSTEKVFPIK